MENMTARKSCPELLREAAVLIQEALTSSSPQELAHEVSAVNAPPDSRRATSTSTTHSTPVQAEVARLFAPYGGSNNPRRQFRSTRRMPSPSLGHRIMYTHTFCCLSDQTSTKIPSVFVKASLAASELGEKRITFTGNEADPEVLNKKLIEVFPKLRDAGGFELLKTSGTTRCRNLELIPCPNDGYTVQYLKASETRIGQATIYIRPLQRSLPVNADVNPQNAPGPMVLCITCQQAFPFTLIRDHRLYCKGSSDQVCTGSDEPVVAESTIPNYDLHSRYTATEVGPSSSASTANSAEPYPDITGDDLKEKMDWKNLSDPQQAAKDFKMALLKDNEHERPLVLKIDITVSEEDREKSLLYFYKRKQNWASPVTCTLEGDAAVGEGVVRHFFSTLLGKVQFGFNMNIGNVARTLLFEGEPDHLIPSTSECLVESSLFEAAGRILGHSFLQDGPCLVGLSPAIIHVVLGGQPELATVVTDDCADLDYRATIQLLQGDTALTADQEDKISHLALSWDLPAVSTTNRRWLHNKMLLHAVVRRTTRQVKQLRRGLKESMLWPLLTARADVVPLMFPRAKDMDYTPEMILERINWPTDACSDDDDEEFCVETKCRVAGFLRMFIENASSRELAELLKFWVGWEILPKELNVELSTGTCITSATCFEKLRIPAHLQNYSDFATSLKASVSSVYSGFGLV